MAERNVPLNVRQAVMGHSTAALTSTTYYDLSNEAARDALAAISKVASGKARRAAFIW